MRVTLQQAAAWSSILAAALVALTLLLALMGDLVASETELRDALDTSEGELRGALDAIESELRNELRTSLAAAEGRITSEIRATAARTDAQMKELRGYMVNHLDRQSAAASPAPE